jgi:haloalkane dehalogenase
MKFIFIILLTSITSLSLAQNNEIIKTPIERFSNLPDFNFKSNYIEIENGLSMHYIDEGNKDAPIVLLLHGEPYWSFGFRKIIPILKEKGYRVIAPDLIGFGKSDKYKSKDKYTYSNQTKWVTTFIDKLELSEIKLFAHDWGGMIAMRIVADKPQLFSHVIVSYAFLFTGEENIPESFDGWKNYSQNEPSFQAGQVMDWGSHTKISQKVKDAYNAPFPNEEYMYGVRSLPSLIPENKNDKEAILNTKLREKLKSFNKPFLTIWGNNDDAMWVGKDKIIQSEIIGAKNQNHKTLDSDHFIIEDKPTEVSNIILEFISNQ